MHETIDRQDPETPVPQAAPGSVIQIDFKALEAELRDSGKYTRQERRALIRRLKKNLRRKGGPA